MDRLVGLHLVGRHLLQCLNSFRWDCNRHAIIWDDSTVVCGQSMLTLLEYDGQRQIYYAPLYYAKYAGQDEQRSQKQQHHWQHFMQHRAQQSPVPSFSRILVIIP
jgi:hypothetical protein